MASEATAYNAPSFYTDSEVWLIVKITLTILYKNDIITGYKHIIKVGMFCKQDFQKFFFQMGSQTLKSYFKIFPTGIKLWKLIADYINHFKYRERAWIKLCFGQLKDKEITIFDFFNGIGNTTRRHYLVKKIKINPGKVSHLWL